MIKQQFEGRIKNKNKNKNKNKKNINQIIELSRGRITFHEIYMRYFIQKEPLLKPCGPILGTGVMLHLQTKIYKICITILKRCRFD